MNPYNRIKFKILVMGEAGVGKSCLVRRFANNLFSDQHHLTIGIDFKTCPMVVAGHEVSLQIWDTAGEERFRALMPVYYRNAQGILLVYDTTWGTSFRNMAHWLQEIRANCARDINILMVGNKCDELKKRQVTVEQATQYAAFCGIPFLEASAKTGDGVKDVFATIALSIFNRLVPTPLTLLRPLGNPYGHRLYAGQDRGYVADADDQSQEGHSIRLEDNKRSGKKRIFGSCC